MTDEVKKLKELIDGTDNIVFFGGADGLSRQADGHAAQGPRAGRGDIRKYNAPTAAAQPI